MQASEILDYAQTNWSDYYKTVTEISINKKTQQPLVKSDFRMYDFDDIVKNLFPQNTPTSADGLILIPRKTILVEFKSGFFKKITKGNFKSDKAICEHLNAICSSYWELFFKKQKLETQELIDSLKLKAVESYTIVEKHIAPICSGSTVCHISLIVVIDCNSDDGIEDTLAELSGKSIRSNQCSAVRNSLRRYWGRQDVLGNPYYYLDIQVMSPIEFQHYLNSIS